MDDVSSFFPYAEFVFNASIQEQLFLLAHNFKDWIYRNYHSMSMALCETLGIFSIWTEGNVLFNNALNTFYLWIYGIRHMVKDHSDSERGNLLPPHRLLFLISSKGSFICIITQTGYHIPQPLLAHTTASPGALAGMRIYPYSF